MLLLSLINVSLCNVLIAAFLPLSRWSDHLTISWAAVCFVNLSKIKQSMSEQTLEAIPVQMNYQVPPVSRHSQPATNRN